MQNALRLILVAIFLVLVNAAQPAAQQNCGEYQCRIANYPGSGYHCANEGEIDCICNAVACFCGECYCFDEGDCVLMPYQG